VAEQGTIVDLWQRAGSHEDTAAFLVKEQGEWREVSWRSARERVDELAAGFLAIGLRKGDRAAIASRTRLEWTLSDYALASMGAVVVPIYQTSSGEECAYIVEDSGARALLCDDADQLAKVRSAGAALPALEHAIVFDEAPDGAVSLAEIAALGRAHLEAQPDSLAEARGQVSESDVLTFIYTSGTTGDPKGCVLTHRNWYAMADSVRQVAGFLTPDDVVLLFLPLAHNFARLVQFAGAAIGFRIAFCPDIVQVTRALTEVRPTVLPSVPRLFEMIHTNVRSKLDQATGARRRLVDWSLAVGARAASRRERGARVSPLLGLQLGVADRLVYSKITERLGGRVRLAISGGAPLSKEIIEFFAAFGVLILEGYGLTETTSGCTLNTPTRYRFGTVGPALPGIEVTIADDGEILVRGDTIFQGYHGREVETREILGEDGWLQTGDIGSLDGDGFVTITDRKKDLIITSGGKNVSPQNLENALKASGVVSQALVVGDNRPYIVALVSPDRSTLDKDATDDQVRTLVQSAVDEVNSHLGPAEQIRRFAVLPRDFSAEEGEVTPTLKLRRRVCEDHFRDELEQLYGGARGSA
jgi:long-chain acyl-CoA synthetase